MRIRVEGEGIDTRRVESSGVTFRRRMEDSNERRSYASLITHLHVLVNIAHTQA